MSKQLVPIALDLVVDPTTISERVIEWMILQGAGPLSVNERARLQIASVKTCQLVQDLVREIGRSMDERAGV